MIKINLKEILSYNIDLELDILPYMLIENFPTETLQIVQHNSRGLDILDQPPQTTAPPCLAGHAHCFHPPKCAGQLTL